MRVSRVSGLVLALGIAALIGGDARATHAAAHPAPGRAAFAETAWPFLRDQWGFGRALRCDRARCGAELRLYVRSKVGFCDCFNHVDDDDDVDRLVDFDLIGGDRVIPRGTGRRIAVAANPARLRFFRIESATGPARAAMAIVVATDCQALVAVAVSERDASPAIEAAVLDVLRDTIRPAAVAMTSRTDAAP